MFTCFNSEVFISYRLAQLILASINPERPLATTFAEKDSAQTELITNLKTKSTNKFRRILALQA